MKTLIPFWLLAITSVHLLAQQPQHVCQLTKITSNGTPAVVHVSSRLSGAYSGNLAVSVDVSCDPNSASRPEGTMTLNFATGDSGDTITATNIAQLISTRGAVPTAYMSGRCQLRSTERTAATGGPMQSCHYWIMFAQIHTSPPSDFVAAAPGVPTTDIVGFQVVDDAGKRIVYGAGPVSQGAISVTSPAY